MDLTSGVDGNDLLTSKRQEINERLVQEGDPAVRTRLNAHRNIIASIQGKVQRGGMLRQLGLVGVIDGGGSSTGKQAENKPMAGSSERKDEL